jgi:hypothetical protein
MSLAEIFLNSYFPEIELFCIYNVKGLSLIMNYILF